MRVLAVWALLLTYVPHASACVFSFSPSFRGFSGRVAGIDLAVKHGAIASLRSVPVGWELHINNDPSWNVKASGHALVGAAFLSPSDLLGLVSIIPEPGYTCTQLQQPGFLRFRLRLYENDQMKDTIIDHLAIAD